MVLYAQRALEGEAPPKLPCFGEFQGPEGGCGLQLQMSGHPGAVSTPLRAWEPNNC